MIYRNIYFKECNHVKIVFEKNAEFNVLSNCDLPNVRALGHNKKKQVKLIIKRHLISFFLIRIELSI